MRYTPSAFLVPLFNKAASAAWSETLEQSVAYFALPSRKTFAATAVYICCYKNSSLQDARAALQSQAQTSARGCFAAMSSTPVTIPFQIPYQTGTNDAATLNAVTRCHQPLRTQDAFAAAAE
jgi:hypothetical protein